MNKLIMLILILIFSACAKGPSSQSNFKLVLTNLSNDGELSGGVFVETFEISSTKLHLIKLDASNSSEIPYGLYNLILVAFSGPNEAEGSRRCGSITGVKLDKAEVVINVTLNAENCSQAIYSRAILAIKKDKKSFWDKDYWNQSYWGP